VQRPESRKGGLSVVLYDPSARGGICHHTYHLAESLARSGCAVTLLTGDDYELRHLPRRFVLSVFSKPSWIRAIGLALSWGRQSSPSDRAADRGPAGARRIAQAAGKAPARRDALRRLRLRLLLLRAAARIVRSRSRVVHTQWITYGEEDVRFLRLLKRLGVRTVYTAHDLLPNDAPQPGDRELFAKIYRLVDQIVVFDESNRQELVRSFGIEAGRVSVIPNGSDGLLFPEPSQESARAELGIPRDRRVILFFGHIKRYKGLEYLIEAFDRVRETVDNALLLVAGHISRRDPAQFEYYSGLVAALRTRKDAVCAAEYIPMSRVGVYLAASDVVVLPYVQTYHSAVLMMAYAAGKPVVVTDTGGLAEAVEDGKTGFVVPPRDADALADRIAAVLTLPDRGRAMGERARELSKTVYSWSAVAEKTAALYRRLLEPGRAVRKEEASKPRALSSVPRVDGGAQARAKTRSL